MAKKIEKNNYKQVMSFQSLIKKGDKFVGNDLGKCPYCGANMEKGEIITKYGKDDVVKCSNEKCDCYGRIRLDNNGKMKIISSPANKELRMLRKEAHHYICVLESTYSRDTVYQMIQNKMTVPVNGLHVGYLSEGGCIDVINAAIDVIHTQVMAGRLTIGPSWSLPNKYISKESQIKLEEIKNKLAQIR